MAFSWTINNLTKFAYFEISYFYPTNLYYRLKCNLIVVGKDGNLYNKGCSIDKRLYAYNEKK